jgi:hypothetical protein
LKIARRHSGAPTLGQRMSFFQNLLNATTTETISFQTIADRIMQQHTVAAPVLITFGVLVLFYGDSLYSFSRKNILVPTMICATVHLFRPTLADCVLQFPQVSQYVPCVSNKSCTWEKHLFEVCWLCLAVSASMVLNQHTKRGEKALVATFSSVAGSMAMGTFAQFFFRQLITIRELLCHAVSAKSCPSQSLTNDTEHIAVVTVLFGIIGALLLVPRALLFYKTMLRAILSVVGAFLVMTGVTVLIFVHGFHEMNHVLSGWLSLIVVVTPALAFSGFIWQETSYAKYLNEKHGESSGGHGSSASEGSDGSSNERNDEVDQPSKETSSSMIRNNDGRLPDNHSFNQYGRNANIARRHARAKTPTRRITIER